MTWNPEIQNTPVWGLPNIWRLGQVRITKFRWNVSNKILVNPAKCQGNSLYCFCVIKEKPTGWSKITTPTQIRVKVCMKHELSIIPYRKQKYVVMKPLIYFTGKIFLNLSSNHYFWIFCTKTFKITFWTASSKFKIKFIEFIKHYKVVNI